MNSWYDLNNEACHELLPKKTKGNAVFAVHFTVGGVLPVAKYGAFQL